VIRGREMKRGRGRETGVRIFAIQHARIFGG
jgi:hypothetical protein